MYRKVISMLVAAFVGMIVVSSMVSISASDVKLTDAQVKKIVLDRQANMKNVGRNMKIIGGFVKAGMGTTADVKMAAQKLAELSVLIPNWFPKGSSMDEILDPPTGARAKIWQEWDHFIKISMDMKKLALNIVAAANADDKAAIGASMDALAKGACGACHKPYKEKLD